MTKTLLHPGYFGPIDQFYVFVNAEHITWENDDNYQKQTYRNRQYIYGANGRLMLNIPILHTHNNKEGRQKYKDVKIENQFHWQTIHWKSLESAYRSSPFFEFYEDDLRPLFEKKFTFLLDFNYHCWEALLTTLELDLPEAKTDEYIKNYKSDDKVKDARDLITAKRKPFLELPAYGQVFQEKQGFLPNLSILDLLFNKGPQTYSYLKNLEE